MDHLLSIYDFRKVHYFFNLTLYCTCNFRRPSLHIGSVKRTMADNSYFLLTLSQGTAAEEAGERCKFTIRQDPNNDKISLTGFNGKVLAMVVEDVNPVRYTSQRDRYIRVFKSASDVPPKKETLAWFDVVFSSESDKQSQPSPNRQSAQLCNST